MANDIVIEASALTRRFGALTAVDALDLRVRHGEIVGLLGHNGAGKTTTVRLLNGVLDPSAGSARVLGLDPRRDGVALRRRCGVSTETPAVDERLTGRQGLRFFAEVYDVPRGAVERRVDTLLTEFELMHAADARVATYSKGMRQRLALARALLHEPELLFLDEPSSGLDPVAAKAVDERIASQRSRGTSVLLCTHNLAQAEALCDRVVVLEHGRVVASGAPAALAADLGAALRVRVRYAPSGADEAGDGLASVVGVDGVRCLDEAASAGDAPWRTLGFEADDEAAVARVVRALVEAGHEVYAVEPERPSLEDVYFALHQGEGRRAAQGAAAATVDPGTDAGTDATAVRP